MTSEPTLLFWRLDVAYFREEKELIFYDLAGPVKNMAIPQHRPRHKLTQLHNYVHKIPRRFTHAGKSHKAHTLMTKLAMYCSCGMHAF